MESIVKKNPKKEGKSLFCVKKEEEKITNFVKRFIFLRLIIKNNFRDY